MAQCPKLTGLHHAWLVAAILLAPSCAILRGAECDRSRDVIARAGASYAGTGAHVDVEYKRTAAKEYDSILLSYDMVCTAAPHMTGAEYKCESRGLQKLTRAIGAYLLAVDHCEHRSACVSSAWANYKAERGAIEATQCVDAALVSAPIAERRKFETKPQSLVSVPTEGTPHGMAVIGGVGGFLTPVGAAADLVLAFAANSRHELGASVLLGSSNGTAFTGYRARYSYYFSPDAALKPYVRGSLIYYSAPHSPWTHAGQIVEYAPSAKFGPLVEGGVLYDFARWFGVYAEATAGYAFGLNSHSASIATGTTWMIDGDLPIIGVAAGVQFRVAD